MYLNDGIIEEDNSSLKLKDDEETEIKPKLLKKRVDLNDIKSIFRRKGKGLKEYSKAVIKDVERTENERKIVENKKRENMMRNLENETSELEVFKEFESLTDKNKEKRIDPAKTISKKCVLNRSSSGTTTNANVVGSKIWKKNAMTIFENSFVYPFIHASNKYKCFFCSKFYLNPTLLKEHSTHDHNLKEIQKELTIRTRDDYIKVDVSCLQCRICMKTLPSLNDLKIHLKGHGKVVDLNLQDNIIPFKLEGDTFECQVCGETFLKLRLLIIHMSKHFNNYSCEICGSVFISLKLLKRHLVTHQSGSFPCDKCDKVFSSSSKRSVHIKGVHLKQFPRRCPICSERFNSNYQRTKHLRIVHNQSTGLFRCETCGNEYDLKYHLLVHTRSVHMQERNHECEICKARFFSKYDLSRHTSVHTGQKNFVCRVCGKAYARKKTLKDHCKSHDVK